MSRVSRRRPRLSRQAVLGAALALVDRDGARALSMRRLGQELGVEAMSLYTYVSGRAELLDGLSEVMVGALPSRSGVVDWREAVRAFANGIRTTAKRHPQAFLLVGMRPLKAGNALAPVETLLSALQRGGFSPLQAVAAYRLVTAYARGFALAEIEGFTLEESPDISVIASHPAVAAARDAPRALDHDLTFRAGLETILAGLASRSESTE